MSKFKEKSGEEILKMDEEELKSYIAKMPKKRYKMSKQEKFQAVLGWIFIILICWTTYQTIQNKNDIRDIRDMKIELID